jgi:hypothetical protein
MISCEDLDVAPLHGWNRRESAPHALRLRDVRRGEQSRRAHFEDELRRSRQHRLDRGLDRLAGDVSEDITPPAIPSMSWRKPTPPLT